MQQANTPRTKEYTTPEASFLPFLIHPNEATRMTHPSPFPAGDPHPYPVCLLCVSHPLLPPTHGAVWHSRCCGQNQGVWHVGIVPTPGVLHHNGGMHTGNPPDTEGGVDGWCIVYQPWDACELMGHMLLHVKHTTNVVHAMDIKTTLFTHTSYQANNGSAKGDWSHLQCCICIVHCTLRIMFGQTCSTAVGQQQMHAMCWLQADCLGVQLDGLV